MLPNQPRGGAADTWLPKKARVPKVKPRVKAPAGDVASSGGDYGMAQAKKAERSKPVKRAQRQVYDAQPTKQKQRIVANATGSVKANVKPVHDARVKRNLELARSAAQKDTKGSQDMGRANRYLAANPKILKPEKPHKGGLTATITGAAKVAGTVEKAAANVAGHVVPAVLAAAAPWQAATIHAIGGKTEKTALKIAKNAGRDLVDIPANTVPSLYRLGEVAVTNHLGVQNQALGDQRGGVKKAGEMLAKPYIDLAKHPGKSIVDHPVGSGLLAGGAEAAVGRGLGRAMRASPSQRLRQAASTEGRTATVPTTNTVHRRPYSKNVIHKAVVVGYEKIRGKPKTRTMTSSEIARRVDAAHHAAKQTQTQNAARAEKQAKKALGKKPSAAVSAVAQGITDHTPADLRAYLVDLGHAAKGLTGDELKANARTQAMLQDALKKHDPAKVQAAATAYQQHRDGLEKQALDRGLVKPGEAEAARLAPTAARRLGASGEGKRTARATAKDQRVQATRAKRKATKVAVVAERDLQQARANARVSAARSRTSPGVVAAERESRRALADVARLKREHAKATASEIAGAKRSVAQAQQRAAAADRTLAKSLADARVSVSSRMRSTSVKAAEQAQRAAGVALAKAERDHQRAQVEAGTAKGRAQVLTRNVGGGGRAGGYGVQVAGDAVAASAERVRNARAAKRAADVTVSHARGRTRGVAPAEHDSLLRALAGRDESRTGVAQARQGVKAARSSAKDRQQQVGQRVAELRAAARDSSAAAGKERARVKGVAPAEHNALLGAIAGRDAAQTALGGARATAKQAVAAHRAVKAAPYVDASGKPITIADARATLPKGAEPAFVSHTAVPPRTGALPTRRPTIPVVQQRTGEAVNRGTVDLSPEKLVQQSVHTQRLIDAADAHRRFVEDMGHRGTPSGPVVNFKTEKVADNTARNLKTTTGVEWSSVHHPDGGFVVIPKSAAARAAQHENVAVSMNHPALRAASGLWQRNVLSFSTKWLYGQGAEPAIRAAVARAGIRSWLTAHKVLAEAARRDPTLAEQTRAHTIGGTLGSIPKRRDIVVAEDFADTRLAPLANAMARVRRTHGPKELVNAYQGFTNLVMGTLNGGIQLPFQTAMLGKALRDSPLMDGHTVKLSTKAIQAAVDGLSHHQTNAYADLARSVQDMYGKYGGFSPRLQSAILNYTPFIAWTLSATRFLGVVLPRDHPVLLSTLAAANQATEGWRKQHGLYFDPFGETPGMAKAWLQGSIPGKGGSHQTKAGYATPFSVVNSDAGPLGTLADNILPQLSGAIPALGFGVDWKGTPLAGRSGADVTMARRNAAAVTGLMINFVPAASRLFQVAGVRTPDQPNSKKMASSVGTRARQAFDPFMYTPGHTDSGGGASTSIVPVKVTPVKIRPIKVKPVKVK